MKRAILEKSAVGATLQPSGGYKFGPALNRPNGKQCGGFTNDALFLQGVNRMLDTLKSKKDAPDFVLVKNGGRPITGGYFVMDFGELANDPKREEKITGHVGVIALVKYDTNGEETGFDAVHYNRMGHEERREEFIAKGSAEWKLIAGFGVGNPVQETEEAPTFEKLVVEPTISAMWNALDAQPDNAPNAARHKKAMGFLNQANKALRGEI